MNTASTRDAALGRFNQARDAFLGAFGQAPDDALDFLPQGDDYALGTLAIHLCDSIADYHALLEQVLRTDFAPLDLDVDGERTRQGKERFALLATLRPTGADRAHVLADLHAAHTSLTDTVSKLDAERFARTAPVTFTAGSEPYPTSAQAILGWLTDHYDEHTPQVKAMLEQWRQTQS